MPQTIDADVVMVSTVVVLVSTLHVFRFILHPSLLCQYTCRLPEHVSICRNSIHHMYADNMMGTTSDVSVGTCIFAAGGVHIFSG